MSPGKHLGVSRFRFSEDFQRADIVPRGNPTVFCCCCSPAPDNTRLWGFQVFGSMTREYARFFIHRIKAS